MDMARNKKQKYISDLRAVTVSSLVSIGDVVFSFIVAAITGSTVMFAQGLQGVADLTTTATLFLGVKRSKRPPSKKYPLGYGREIFFWALISSLFAFLVSGALASWRAIRELLDGGVLENIWIALIALSFGFIMNGYSLRTSLKRLAQGSKTTSFWEYLRQSSLIETKMTLLVDFMGTSAALLGLIALGLYQITGNAVFDSVGALIIGILTAAGALFIVADLKSLIAGQSPNQSVINTVRETAISVKGVEDVLDLRAVTIGAGRIMVILELHFKDNLNTDDIEKITDEVKDRVQKAEPEVESVHVEAETPDAEL